MIGMADVPWGSCQELGVQFGSLLRLMRVRSGVLHEVFLGPLGFLLALGGGRGLSRGDLNGTIELYDRAARPDQITEITLLDRTFGSVRE